MKSLSLLLAVTAGVVVASGVQAKPAASKPPAKPRATNALPAEVRAYLPKAATSLYWGKPLKDAGGEPMLVHLWAAGRKTSPDYPHQFEASPFCVDWFVQGDKDSSAAGQWSRVATTLYLGEDGPRDPQDVSARWLYAAKKQGPVLIIVSPSYLSTRFTVITYPRGIGQGDESPAYVQNFYQGGVGGGKTIYDFEVDKRGIMTVLEKSWYQNNPPSTTVYAWNGREYVKPSSR